MAIILDTDVIIRGEKGTFDLKKWVSGHLDEQFEIAAISIAELWHGVERATAPHRNRRLQYLQSILPALVVRAYTEQTGYEHARIWAELEVAGKMIGYYDLIIAATALEMGSPVATFNRKHFDVVPGLKIVEPK